MEFNKANLKALLSKSEGLDLLPSKKRRETVSTILDSKPKEQMKIFKILLVELREMLKAEAEYQKNISKALDNFTGEVQNIQKTAIKNVRIKIEKVTREKEEKTMEKLLSQLK